MPDWVQWLTLGFAGVGAAGGVASSVISAKADSQENQRIWERDRVTERYTAFYSAVTGIDKAYVAHVDRKFGTPSVDDVAYRAIDDALGVVNDKFAEASVVARPRVERLMGAVFKVDITVLAPFSPTGALPAIASNRIRQERLFLTQFHLLLLRAMRADLGLTTKEQNQQVDAAIGQFLDTASPTYRSPFTTSKPDDVVANLKAYGVRPIVGGHDDYRASTEDMFFYWGGLSPDLVQQGVQAVAVRDIQGVVRAGVDTAFSAGEQDLRLRQIGRLVESGFRASPGVSGYRRIADGSIGWAWLPRSPSNLLDQP